MGKQHCILAPSAAHRWLKCAAAPLQETHYPDLGNPAAEQGTKAHEWAEKVLKHEILFEEVPKEFKAIERYIKYVEAHKKEGHQVLIEKQVTIPEIRGFGHVDCIVFYDHSIEIIDLKFGRIPVDTYDNPQLLIYALGVLNEFPNRNIDFVKLAIFQPNSNDEKYTAKFSFYDVEKVKEFGKIYKAQANKIFAIKRGLHNIEYVKGEHCIYCRHRYQCPTLDFEQLFGFEV